MPDDFSARLRRVSTDARFVFWRDRATPSSVLEGLASTARDLGVDELDRYGERGAVAQLETEVAELLGKAAAVMFPSGTMAQQCALRVWCDRTGSRRVALPDLSHLLTHEADGPRRLHGFEFEHLTTGRTAPTAASLRAVPGRLGAVLVELPLRDAGCLLPTWEELTELSATARSRDTPLHVDGARIWESTSHWGRSLAEVGTLVDSIYVSLYKGLGAPHGALVACDPEVAEELRLWRKRMGGTLFSMTAPALGGLHGLREHLPRMAEHHRWAVDLAAALTDIGLRVTPDPPHTNTFEVHAPGDPDEINERLLDWIGRQHVVPSGVWRAADVRGWAACELACQDAVHDFDPADVAGWIREVVIP